MNSEIKNKIPPGPKSNIPLATYFLLGKIVLTFLEKRRKSMVTLFILK